MRLVWLCTPLLIACGDATSSPASEADTVERSDAADSSDAPDTSDLDTSDPNTRSDTSDTSPDVAPVTLYPHTLTTTPRLTTPYTALTPLRVQPALAIGEDQRLAMAWTGRDGDSLGIVLALARLDDITTDTVSPFIANTDVTGIRNEPALCALTGGGYALAWSVDLQDGPANLQVAWRRFAPDLTPLDPHDRIVETDRPGNHWLAEIACDPRGGFVLAGVRSGLPDAGFSAFFQRIAADGTPSPAVAALPDPPGDPAGSSELFPQVGVADNGEVVLTWEQTGACAVPPCGDDTALAYRRYPADGAPGPLAFHRGAPGRDASVPVLAVDPEGTALLGGVLDNRLALQRDSGVLESLALPVSGALVTTSSSAVATGTDRFALVHFAGTGANVSILYHRVVGTAFAPDPLTLATGSFPLAYRPAIAARADLRVVAWTESLGSGSFAVRVAAFTE